MLFYIVQAIIKWIIEQSYLLPILSLIILFVSAFYKLIVPMSISTEVKAKTWDFESNLI